MASESKVIRNLKLRLRTVNGKNYMISRSMQVTQKAKSISRTQSAAAIENPDDVYVISSCQYGQHDVLNMVPYIASVSPPSPAATPPVTHMYSESGHTAPVPDPG